MKPAFFRYLASAVCVIVAAACLGCDRPQEQRVLYVTTINPLRAILAELVGDRGEVKVLLAPGASPHTYEPRPSDAVAAESALALFYAAEDIDLWAAKLPAKVRVDLFRFVPAQDRLVYEDEQNHAQEGDGEQHHDHAHDGDHDHDHHHSGYNGHFWSDPRIVNAMLPSLVEQLINVDPAGLETYRYNASRFSSELNALDAEMKKTFEGMQDRPVFMFHPSWSYFMHRYGLSVAGMIEPFPGKEPTAKFLQGLIETAKTKQVRAVFTEPQLPKRPAEVVAEACSLPLHEIDPNGGVDGRRAYRELIAYNATVLKKALQ